MKNENLLSYTFKFATGVCAVIGIATVSTIVASKIAGKTLIEEIDSIKNVLTKNTPLSKKHDEEDADLIHISDDVQA